MQSALGEAVGLVFLGSLAETGPVDQPTIQGVKNILKIWAFQRTTKKYSEFPTSRSRKAETYRTEDPQRFLVQLFYFIEV